MASKHGASQSNGRKLDAAKKGGVMEAIVPPKKPVNNFPLMSYLSRNCSFSDDEESKDLLDEEALKAENDRRTEELLSQAAQAPHESRDSSDDERKKALEVLHSLEFARNQEDTWKFSRPASQTQPNYGGFLHPLRRNDKEDEYFSGTRKTKQPRERKRSRSEEVVLIEEGKLISKTGEPSQLPIRFTHPSCSPRPRVPSVGLPFTPAPPPPVEKSVWYQKSGAQLFSEVQSKTLVAYGVNCDEDEALALVLAESIRTAKEDEQRMINIREMYKLQCASLPSTPKLSPDPPAPVWNDSVGPLACSASPKDAKMTGAIKKAGNSGSKSGFTLLEQASDSVRKSVNDEIDVSERSSHMTGDGLQQRSRYDHERNAEPLGSLQSKSHLNNSFGKKPLQGVLQCVNEINDLHPQLTMESSEAGATKLHLDLIPQKPESRDKLTTSTISHLGQQISCHVDQQSPFSDHMTHVTSITETCSKELLSLESASNEALNKITVKVANDPHKIELSSSNQHNLSKHVSCMESTRISNSGINPKRCEYGDLQTDQSGIGNACTRSTRLNRVIGNTVNSNIPPERGGETITLSSSRLPTSKPALMSAIKAFISTDPSMTVSDYNASIVPQYGVNQKLNDKNIGKSENVNCGFYSSSESTRAVDENMNETKGQPLHTGSVISDLPKNKTFDPPMSLDQNSNTTQMLSKHQALESKRSVLQDRQNRIGLSYTAEPNLNERNHKTQVPAVNPCNSLHSSAASTPGPCLNPVPPSCVLGVANVPTNGLSAHSSSVTGSPVKLLTSQAPSSFSNLPNSKASRDPPVPSHTLASATSIYMPVGLSSGVSENPCNLMDLPSGVPGILNMLPSANAGLPGFHAACFPGAPMGSSMKQLDNKNLYIPVPGGVPGMPGMPSSLLGAFSGLHNVLPGISGLTNTMPGISNILPGGLSGLPPNFYSGLPTLENTFINSALGSQKPLEMQGTPPLNILGVSDQMPPLNTLPIDPYLASMQNFSAGLPCSDSNNPPHAAPARSLCNSGLISPQPGSTPLVHGKGRGRLAKVSYPA